VLVSLPGGVCSISQCTLMWYKTEASPLEIADGGPVGCQMSTRSSCWSLSPGCLSCSQQLCLLRPHIPAGQIHSSLITCADPRLGQAQEGTSNKHDNAGVNLLRVLCNCQTNKRWSGEAAWWFMGQCTEWNVLSFEPSLGTFVVCAFLSLSCFSFLLPLWAHHRKKEKGHETSPNYSRWSKAQRGTHAAETALCNLGIKSIWVH